MSAQDLETSKCIILPPPVAELLISTRSPWTSLVLLGRCFRCPRASHRATCGRIFAEYPDAAWHERVLRLLAAELPQSRPMNVSAQSLRDLADRLRAWSSSILQDGHEDCDLREQVRFVDSFANKLESSRDLDAGSTRYKHSAQRLLSSFQVRPLNKQHQQVAGEESYPVVLEVCCLLRTCLCQ